MYHTDYRPQTFEEVIGNKETIESLKAFTKDNKRPHSYLFHGPSGCGKTTLARIMAKELGCSEKDIIEVNISNNRGIDTARDIIDKMKLKPMYGKTRIYILDEVHKSTNEFQNAMLKPLEEPPGHVYFILCTTEPEKLLKTVHTRCTSFSISALGERKIFSYLNKIIEKEKIKIDEEVVKAIAKTCQGSVRSALVMLEQAKDIKGTTEEIIEAIGIITEENKTVIELCRRLSQPKVKWKSIAAVLKNIEGDPEGIRRAVLGYFSSMLINTGNPQAAVVIECFEDNYFNTGKAGLVKSCYLAINS